MQWIRGFGEGEVEGWGVGRVQHRPVGGKSEDFMLDL